MRGACLPSPPSRGRVGEGIWKACRRSLPGGEGGSARSAETGGVQIAAVPPPAPLAWRHLPLQGRIRAARTGIYNSPLLSRGEGDRGERSASRGGVSKPLPLVTPSRRYAADLPLKGEVDPSSARPRQCQGAPAAPYAKPPDAQATKNPAPKIGTGFLVRLQPETGAPIRPRRRSSATGRSSARRRPSGRRACRP